MRRFPTEKSSPDLAYAVPGFILIKVKAVKSDHIASFSKLLMFVSQPALTLYSFNKANYTKDLGINLLIFLGIITLAQLLFIAVFYLIFRKKMTDVRYRIATGHFSQNVYHIFHLPQQFPILDAYLESGEKERQRNRN